MTFRNDIADDIHPRLKNSAETLHKRLRTMLNESDIRSDNETPVYVLNDDRLIKVINDWDPAEHPRSPKTGKFIENPAGAIVDLVEASIGDEIVAETAGNKIEGEVVEIRRTDDAPKGVIAVAEMESGSTWEIDNQTSRLIDIRTGGSDGDGSGVRTPITYDHDAKERTYADGSSWGIDASVVNMSDKQRDRMSAYINDVLPEQVSRSEDYERIVSEISVVENYVDRASMGNNRMKVSDAEYINTVDHETGHAFLLSYGFDVSGTATDKAHEDSTSAKALNNPIPLSEIDDYTLNESIAVEDVDGPEDLEVGDTVQLPDAGSTTDVEVTDIDDDDTVHTTAGPVPDTLMGDLKKKVEKPERVRKLAEETDKAFESIQETLNRHSKRRAKEIAGNHGYASNNAHETFAVFHETMQNPGAYGSVWNIMDEHPDFVRAYLEIFDVPDETAEILEHASQPLRGEIFE